MLVVSQHNKYTLEKTEGAIKNGQPRDTVNLGHIRRRQTKQKHNTKTKINEHRGSHQKPRIDPEVKTYAVVITTWLTVTKYLKWQYIFSFLRRYFIPYIFDKTLTGLDYKDE
jgi:hypothetical protein